MNPSNPIGFVMPVIPNPAGASKELNSKMPADAGFQQNETGTNGGGTTGPQGIPDAPGVAGTYDLVIAPPGANTWQPATGSLLPAPPVVDGTYDLVVSGGVPSWDVVGGFAINSFTASGGFGGTVEVGTAIVNPTTTQSYSETPDSASLAWTNPTGSQTLSAPFTSGTMAATFQQSGNGNTSVATLTATKGSTTKTRTLTTTWAGANLAGVETTGAPTAGQTLWDSLASQHKTITTGFGGSYALSATGSQSCYGAVLNSLGRLPTIKDQNGFSYTATSIGTAVITENGTSQTYLFFTWANPGASATFTFS